MKCISKRRRFFGLFIASVIFLTGCAEETIVLNDNYQISYEQESTIPEETSETIPFFAEELVVAEDKNIGTEDMETWVCQGSGAFNLDRKEIVYSQNIYQKLYPASTTKIMTAYLILKYGNLDDSVTVNAEAANLPSDSSVANLKEGDTFTVRDLLYGLLLPSGNDAAVALACYLSGTEEAFAKRMTEEAHAMGATRTNFLNAHGLPDPEHYTCVYDIHLIFRNTIQYEEFLQIINSASYQVSYTDKDNNAQSMTWNNTNGYISGREQAPDDFVIIGGKTGTTYEAGFCLVLLSENPKKEQIISVVYKADCRWNLYWYTNQILSRYAK